MKNYVKVMNAGKNIDIFTFEDADETATEAALSRAESLARKHGAKIAVWSLTGHVAQRSYPVVGEVPEHQPWKE